MSPRVPWSMPMRLYGRGLLVSWERKIVWPLTVRMRVVEIAALAVEQLAEQAALGEDEGQHLAAVVAAVLHHHAVPLLLLRRLHELPALLHGDGGGDLGGGVLSRAHRGQADRHVPLPR